MKYLFSLLTFIGFLNTKVVAQDTTAYWPNGNKKLEMKNKRYIAWYENGNRKEEGNFNDGSIWRFWDKNGKLLFEGEYQINLSTPQMVFEHPTDKQLRVDTIYIKGYYKDGGEGLVIRYYEYVDVGDGRQMIVRQIKKETKEGYWRYYDKNEKLMKEEWYENGKLKKEISY